jgi:hypothetical protein
MWASGAHSAGPGERSQRFFSEDVNWHFACMKGWDEKRHGRVGTNLASCLRAGCRFQISVLRLPVKTDCLRCFHSSPGECRNSSVLTVRSWTLHYTSLPINFSPNTKTLEGTQSELLAAQLNRHKYIINKYISKSVRSTRLRFSQKCRWKWRVFWAVMSCQLIVTDVSKTPWPWIRRQ